MSTFDKPYRNLYYDEPVVQAEFEQMVQRIRDAEQARVPAASRQREVEEGSASNKEYRTADDAFIAANNAIAAAQRAVDDFLAVHRNYRVRGQS